MFSDSMQAAPALNPVLDVDALKARFAATGRAQIPDVLTAASAGAFYKCLTEEVKWRLAYNDGNRAMEMTEPQILAMNPQQRDMLHQSIFQRAAQQFQYIYSDYPVAKTMNDPSEPHLYVHQILQFINSEPFLDFLREVTGIEGRLYADGHATCFNPANFLTIHDDRDTNDNRMIAYVFNMTPHWRADWGGNLEFYDENYEIVESFKPSFNRLNIFRVPQAHAVTFVPPFATASRYGMTGWFHRAA